MNKANFRDIGKTLTIILFFIIIIGLIIIVTDPIKFNTMIFGDKVVEGLTPSVNECHNCVIVPTKGSITTDFLSQDPNYISNRINQIKGAIESNIEALTTGSRYNNPPNKLSIVNNGGLSTNLYSDTTNLDSDSVHYVFSSWNGDYNTASNEWMNNCSSSMYNHDGSCCFKTDNSIQTDFYLSNYLYDTSFDIPYYGIVFKYTGTRNTTISADQYKESASATTDLDNIFTSSTYTYTPVTTSDILSFVNSRFTYTTNITDASRSSLTITSPNQQLNCLGQITTIPNKIAQFGNCNTPAISELTNTEQMNLEFARQKCWDLGTQINTETMLQECSFQELTYQECSGAYLPKNFTIPDSLTNPPDYTSINNILNSSSNGGDGQGDSGDGVGGGDVIVPQISSGLQQATDALVSAFDKRLDSLNIFLGQSPAPEYPNIGQPTYLNIGTCDNNSPYVYNSSCSNQNTNNEQNGMSQSGGFLYQYQCYPSLTGQFKDCGPPGYQPRPEF